MEPDKTLEIARRYMTSDTTDNFACTKEHLIAFVEAITEAEQKPTTIRVPMPVFVKLVKDVCTVKDLLIAMKAAEEE